MGNCFSDPSHPSKTKGQGQKLGSGPARPTPAATTPAPAPGSHAPPQTRYTEPPRVLGGGVAGGEDEDQRERMRRAAEERALTASSKGVSNSNPKSGQLSAKLAAERKAGSTSPRQQDERLMDKGQWN